MVSDFNEKIPVVADVDVLICGGGPAGVGAAIRAAREGVSVMIVEMQGCLGGIATAGMMSDWGGRSSSKVLPEILDRTYDLDHGYTWKDENTTAKTCIAHDLEIIALDQIMQEHNVRILYYTMVCDAVVKDDQVQGVIIQNKSGRGYIKAKCVVDSTGDGDVAAAAGVPFFKGREEDGKMQPCSVMFKIGGVDYETAVFPPSFETTVETKKGELQALAKKYCPSPRDTSSYTASPNRVRRV